MRKATETRDHVAMLARVIQEAVEQRAFVGRSFVRKLFIQRHGPRLHGERLGMLQRQIEKHPLDRCQLPVFATDPQALALSLAALAAGEDRQLAAIERVFLYLPLEHAESLAMQARSVALYEQLAREAAADERALFDGFLDYARKHYDVVARFGRFPHRNAILGRSSTPEELEFLKQPGSRF
jgi:hypothetical protein